MQDHPDDDSPRAAVGPEGDERREHRGERLTIPGSRDAEDVKEYVGVVWIGDDPGIRIRVMAEGSEAAGRLVDDHFGAGHVVSLWNEQDALRRR